MADKMHNWNEYVMEKGGNPTLETFPSRKSDKEVMTYGLEIVVRTGFPPRLSYKRPTD